MGEENRCFVGGLSWNTDDRLLSEAFAQYGVVDAKVREALRRSLPFFSAESTHSAVGCRKGSESFSWGRGLRAQLASGF